MLSGVWLVLQVKAKGAVRRCVANLCEAEELRDFEGNLYWRISCFEATKQGRSEAKPMGPNYKRPMREQGYQITRFRKLLGHLLEMRGW